MDMPLTLDTGALFRDVVAQEARAVALLDQIPSAQITTALDLLRQLKGRLIVSGMGKSGHIGCKIAATFASTGTPAQFVHPGEASHGDLGMIQPGDVILAISNSGETAELADLLTHAARFQIPLIAITKRANSTLAQHADVLLCLPDVPEACTIGMAPTTSTTCSLVIGDALAVALMTLRQFARETFLTYHPGGKLGAQLLTVGALMHSGAALPIVAAEDSMEHGILEMTQKGFGIAAVCDKGRLTGVITDGDLRRHLDGLMAKSVAQVASPMPKSISAEALASEALGIMNASKISALCVTDAPGQLVGLIHIHDCLRAGVA